jgi:uncharacterized protein
VGRLTANFLTMRNSWFSRIFIGAQGLRSGWGFLLFLLIFAICSVAVNLLANFSPAFVTAQRHAQEARLGTEMMPPGSLLILYGISLTLVLFVSWIMSRIERQRVGVYGLGGTQPFRNLIKGLLSGLVLISLLIGLLWMCQLLVFAGVEQTGSRMVSYAFKWFLVFCLVGLGEGYLSLGYLQYTLTRAFSAWFPKHNRFKALGGFWSAALLLSAAFGLGHGTRVTESPVGLLTPFLFSLVSAYSLWRSGSLWWSIGVHATWDWGQSFVYGVSDSGISCQGRLLVTHPVGNPLLSGGPTGPEGSLFAIGILLIAAILVRLTLPKRPYTEPAPRHVSVSGTSTNLA